MFNQINKDSAGNGDPVVSLSDVEYYTEQIINIYGLEYTEANGLAKDMAKLYEDEKTKSVMETDNLEEVEARIIAKEIIGIEKEDI